MFDTMKLTKIGGALCGALLIFLLINWAGNVIYSNGSGHGQHAEAAYVIEVEVAATPTTTETGPSVADMVASADIAKGAKTFSKCKACHKVEKGVNAVGPSLYGVVERAKASMEGFSYSGALTGLGGNWTVEDLDAFLTKPKAFAPGTKMGFAGVKKANARANLIAYLKSLDPATASSSSSSASSDSSSAATTPATTQDANPSVADLVASADVAKGKKSFGRCKACHKLDKGVNAVGPSLYGVVERAKASEDGFSYSDALTGLGGNWTVEDLDAFMAKPRAFAPGTKMGFAGVKKASDRANLIAYLKSIVK